MCDVVERILDPKDRILDVFASWENSPLVEEVKLEDPNAQKKKKKDKKEPVEIKVRDCTLCFLVLFLLTSACVLVMSY